eukprot:706838-Prorocentrum_minimum.AAC.1
MAASPPLLWPRVHPYYGREFTAYGHDEYTPMCHKFTAYYGREFTAYGAASSPLRWPRVHPHYGHEFTAYGHDEFTAYGR